MRHGHGKGSTGSGTSWSGSGGAPSSLFEPGLAPELVRERLDGAPRRAGRVVRAGRTAPAPRRTRTVDEASFIPGYRAPISLAEALEFRDEVEVESDGDEECRRLLVSPAGDFCWVAWAVRRGRRPGVELRGGCGRPGGLPDLARMLRTFVESYCARRLRGGRHDEGSSTCTPNWPTGSTGDQRKASSTCAFVVGRNNHGDRGVSVYHDLIAFGAAARSDPCTAAPEDQVSETSLACVCRRGSPPFGAGASGREALGDVLEPPGRTGQRS
ncbi:hypothetical protein ACU686_44510 [Yinghuangia aomiensis]